MINGRLTPEEHLERRTARFMEKVYMEPTSGCWLWGGRIDKHQHGYGTFKVKMDKKCKNWKAHRWAAKYIGGMAVEGFYCCHKCDVRSCVNPDHLYLGDAQTNAGDMKKRGRSRNGTSKYTPKLTSEDIPLVRALIARGNMLTEIAPLFDVTTTTIVNIKTGKTWSHVP